MADAASIRVVKQFNYRGTIREFSNRYHFNNGPPADASKWTTFSDAIVTAEKAIYLSLANGGAKIVETIGYAGGSEIPVFTKTYTTDGTGTWTTYIPAPGDAAALIRYSTADRSTKNHPIYCFNYYHAVQMAGSALTSDTLLSNQKTAMQTYSSLWLTGFSDGSANHVRSRPNEHACLGSLVETYITHRDLPH